jgi:ring-1,2-phenylacetyl-CoA epoxidase subunit PaaC
MGDGTDESAAKAQAALNQLMPFTQEFWAASSHESAALANGTGTDMSRTQNRLATRSWTLPYKKPP